jgi:hypothetical protein
VVEAGRLTMTHQLDIEDVLRYPDRPGYKACDTSRLAADGVAPQARTLKARVYEEIKKRPSTPEQVANRLGEPLMNCRPRFSELARQGLIIDSGARGTAMGGRKAIVWAVPPQTLQMAA